MFGISTVAPMAKKSERLRIDVLPLAPTGIILPCLDTRREFFKDDEKENDDEFNELRVLSSRALREIELISRCRGGGASVGR